MIFVDRRQGSGEYLDKIRRAGSVADIGTLVAGDFAIPGFGPGRDSATVGVELKKLGDLMTCIREGRFVGEQVPKLVNTYDAVILVVEGEYRRGQYGAIEVRRGRDWVTPSWMRFISHDGLKDWLNTKRWKMGLQVEETQHEAATVALLRDVERWWEDGWDSHKSEKTMDTSGRLRTRVEEWSEVPLAPTTFPMQVARTFPGLGDERARAAGGHFGSVAAMAGASVDDWEAVPGVGPKTAADVWAALRRKH